MARAASMSYVLAAVDLKTTIPIVKQRQHASRAISADDTEAVATYPAGSGPSQRPVQVAASNKTKASGSDGR